MRLSVFRALGPVLAAFIALAGCGDDAGGPGGSGGAPGSFQQACGMTGAPCNAGFFCDGIMCVQSCTEDAECGAGSCCSSGCYDTSVSQTHCGGCGIGCAGTQQCTGGVCTDLVCSPPSRPGGGGGGGGGGGSGDDAGVDDDAGVPMMQTPAPMQSPGPNGCFMGEECRKDMAGVAACNCGAMPACALGTVCNGGMCLCGATQCGMAQTCCGGTTCADLQNDQSNCGSCGNSCTGGLMCIGGNCACPQGQTACGNACVDMNADTSNCGACGNTCAPGSTCQGGTCDCPNDGELDCDGVCRLETDPMHCGACGNVCMNDNNTVDCYSKDDQDGNPLPVECHCFNDSYSRCDGGECVRLMEGNPVADTIEHCGACNNTCDGGANECNSGACSCPDPSDTECNEECVDLLWNAENCGSCGLACADGEQCLNGTCTCDGAESNDPAHPYGYCPAGGGTYACETIDDELNCGFDCERCNGQSFCDTSGNVSNYACTCEDNALVYCGDPAGPCVDVETDSDNCGSCGFACLDGDACVDGVCDCGAGQTFCDDGSGVFACANTGTDTENCGGCGIRCDTGSGEVCCNSVCSDETGVELGTRDSCGTCNMFCPDGVPPLFGTAPPGVCNWTCGGGDHTGYACGTGDAVLNCN